MPFAVTHRSAPNPHRNVGLSPERIARRRAIRTYFETHMRSRDWSIVQFAARVRCSHSYMSRIISGHRTPSLDTAVVIASVLGVELSEVANVIVG